MKFALLTTLLALVPLIASTPVPDSPLEKRQALELDDRTFGPFALVTSSKKKEFNNLPITSLHIGAAINLAIPVNGPPLPPSESNYYSFYLNTTYAWPPTDPSQPFADAKGALQFPILPQYPEATTAQLVYNSSSNIAQLWLSVLQPEYRWEFDAKKRLGLAGVFDRWFVCDQLSTSYGPKRGIAWKMGKGPIDEPKTCTSVEIKRLDFPKAQ